LFAQVLLKDHRFNMDGATVMSETREPWYVIHNIDQIDSPSLVIYPERVRANIRTAKTIAKDVSLLRPHVKTHKSPDATRLQLSEGIAKYKCATIAEAEMLAGTGAPDVLLAYQPVGPKIQRLRMLTRAYPHTSFSCLVDELSAAEAIADTFISEPRQLPVFIDLNVGMNRTGLSPGAEALQLYRDCNSLTGVHPVGLHAYDGHIHDRDPGTRNERCHAAFAGVRQMQETISRETGTHPIIVAGGSPTFPFHARNENVECSPGTFIYWDKEYLDGLPDQAFLPAALVISRVVSHPGSELLCLDLGHKSVASEKEISRRVFFLNAEEAEAVSHSEEHLVLRIRDSNRYSVGEIFYGLPHHICPTCALYERAVTVVDHMAQGEWRITARDRMLTV
jgi:D-threonine aldolase